MNGGFPLPEVNHGEFTAESPFPMPEAYREAAAFCLAAKLAPEYGAPVQFDANMYLRQIQSGYIVINDVVMEPMLFRIIPYRGFVR